AHVGINLDGRVTAPAARERALPNDFSRRAGVVIVDDQPAGFGQGRHTDGDGARLVHALPDRLDSGHDGGRRGRGGGRRGGAGRGCSGSGRRDLSRRGWIVGCFVGTGGEQRQQQEGQEQRGQG